MPKVTVGVIAYNHERLLRSAVESVLAQDAEFSVEILIADDASTDGTRAVAEDLAGEHRKVSVLEPGANVGGPRNLKRILDNARGEYVALLEGDDRWTAPDKLRRLVAMLDSDPRLAGAYHAVRWVDPAGRTLRIGPDRRGTRTRQDLIRDGSSIPVSAFVFRNRLPPELPASFFVSRIMGDWQLSLVVAAAGPIGYVDSLMGDYLVTSGPDSFTSYEAIPALRETLAVIAALRAEADPDERAWLDSHRSVHLYELARALAATGDTAGAVAAGLAAARLPTAERRLTRRDKRIGLTRVALTALTGGDARTRRRAARLLLSRHPAGFV